MGREQELKVYDNFKQELEDFDIVVMASNERGYCSCVVSVYYHTAVLSLDDMEYVDRAKVVIKKPNMFNMGKNRGIANRPQIEAGMLGGEYSMESIIKLEDPTTDMMMLRSIILTKIEQGKTSVNMPLKLKNDIVNQAKLEGRLAE